MISIHYTIARMHELCLPSLDFSNCLNLLKVYNWIISKNTIVIVRNIKVNIDNSYAQMKNTRNYILLDNENIAFQERNTFKKFLCILLG